MKATVYMIISGLCLSGEFCSVKGLENYYIGHKVNSLTPPGEQTVVTCLDSSSSQTERVAVKEDSVMSYKTGPGRKTGHNVDCSVHYMLTTCSSLSLACHLKLKGRGKNCVRGDKLSLSYGGETFQ